jgi:hypothetical protein
MLTLPASVRVFIARGATDLRRSFDRLSATHPAQLVLELTPREWARSRKDSAAKAAA